MSTQQNNKVERVVRIAVGILLVLLLIAAAAAHKVPIGSNWSQLAFGARTWLLVVAPAVAISLMVGIPLGLLAARIGRLGDRLVTRLLEIIGGFPTIVLVALLRAMAPTAPFWLVAATLALVRVPETVRITRLLTVRFRTSEAFVAARVIGVAPSRIFFVHMLPTMLGSFASLAVASMGVLIGVDAAMTFVGLGAPSQDPSWGSAMAGAVKHGQLQGALAPACAVALTMLASYWVAERLRTGAQENPTPPCISRGQ